VPTRSKQESDLAMAGDLFHKATHDPGNPEKRRSDASPGIQAERALSAALSVSEQG